METVGWVGVVLSEGMGGKRGFENTVIDWEKGQKGSWENGLGK